MIFNELYRYPKKNTAAKIIENCKKVKEQNSKKKKKFRRRNKNKDNKTSAAVSRLAGNKPNNTIASK